LTSYKIGFTYSFLVREYLKHGVALSGCHKEHHEPRSVTGTRKFRVSSTVDYKPKLTLFFNLFAPSPLFCFFVWPFFGRGDFDSRWERNNGKEAVCHLQKVTFVRQFIE